MTNVGRSHAREELYSGLRVVRWVVAWLRLAAVGDLGTLALRMLEFCMLCFVGGSSLQFSDNRRWCTCSPCLVLLVCVEDSC